ncbi:MAG TPA: phosphate signaling complex protein PhoU [Rudaea sp.]|jgi:phosphate transport system protein|nr:phosphate signaling complex protein PhoU [Rudaea sp.]
MSEHILKSFDDELTQLNTSIARMGQLSQTQLAGAIDSLLLRDSTVAAHVVKSDFEVDELERDVDARAIRVLALRQPIARDLRQVLASLRIAIEFERICDFAANIAKRAIALDAHSPDEWINELAELGQLALKLLADVVIAFRERDSEKALDVWAHDEQLDDVYTGIYRRLIDFMKAEPQRVPIGAHLLFIAKNIERIGDHATNIAESVYYLVTGETLAGPRPKGDKSSFDRIEAAS